MSLLAGIVSRQPGASAVPADAVDSLRRELSREPLHPPRMHAGHGFALLECDFGVFEGGITRVSDDGAMSLFAGDPIVDRNGTRLPRSRDLDELHADWRAGSLASVQRVRGSFCGVHFDPLSRRLWLVADKLALRPLYYALTSDFVLFASALRVLEANPLIPQTGDLQGLAETASFGYALGPRTALAAVRVLEPAQIVESGPSGASSRVYWQWATPVTQISDADEICAELKSSFAGAVTLRLDGSLRAVSLLSGGLDSRCVVAQLGELGAELDTIGFGPEGSVDQVLANRVAAALGTRHFDFAAGPAGLWRRLPAAHAAWLQVRGSDAGLPTSRALWTGEGGDRVLAPVNLYEAIVMAMRAGMPGDAIDHYMRAEHAGLPSRIFRRNVRDRIRRLPKSGLLGELERIEHADPGRRFHLYVLLNESRRNIKLHFEDCDRSRIELVMPFYDSRFVATALSFPFNPFLRHRLYHRWLREFQGPVSAVPWQAYPGAMPCPLPLPPELRTQWEGWNTHIQNWEIRRRLESLARSLLDGPGFPAWLIRKPVLRLAYWLQHFGIRQFDYLFEVAQPFVRHPPERPTDWPAP